MRNKLYLQYLVFTFLFVGWLLALSFYHQLKQLQVEIEITKFKHETNLLRLEAAIIKFYNFCVGFWGNLT